MFSAFIQIFTTLLVIYGFRVWRLQMIGKRRFEIAEAAVLAAYNVSEALASIRADAYRFDEVEDRQRNPNENSTQQGMLDRYYVPLKRSQAANDAFAELSKCRLLCTVHFGERSPDPFQQLFDIRNQVIGAAQTARSLVLAGLTLDADPQGHFPRLHARMWGWGDEKDEDARIIRAAVTAIEILCRPHLSPPDDLKPFRSIITRVLRALR
jgi:hypothetical protein